MAMNKIEIRNEHGSRVGYWTTASGWLPTFIYIDGELYQRYGRVNDYHYQHEPNVYLPRKDEITID